MEVKNTGYFCICLIYNRIVKICFFIIPTGNLRLKMNKHPRITSEKPVDFLYSFFYLHLFTPDVKYCISKT